jgi:hypothetical protein
VVLGGEGPDRLVVLDTEVFGSGRNLVTQISVLRW